MTLPTPVRTAGAVVRPEWIDYNGHMNVGYYHVAFDVAAETATLLPSGDTST